MAAKKNAKSSKTAHVLNVLSGHSEAAVSAPTVGEEGAPWPGEPAQPASRPALPPILEVARADDEALSEKIHDALVRELDEAGPAPAEEPDQDPPPALDEPEPERVEEEPILTQAVEPPQPAPRAGEPPLTVPVAELPGGVVYLNVMEALVEELAPKYIALFGLCTCPRCAADVKALALTNLPPKYVVIGRGEAIPMLTVYERRYSTALIAQILTACKVVMDGPRHDPTDQRP